MPDFVLPIVNYLNIFALLIFVFSSFYVCCKWRKMKKIMVGFFIIGISVLIFPIQLIFNIFNETTIYLIASFVTILWTLTFTFVAIDMTYIKEKNFLAIPYLFIPVLIYITNFDVFYFFISSLAISYMALMITFFHLFYNLSEKMKIWNVMGIMGSMFFIIFSIQLNNIYPFSFLWAAPRFLLGIAFLGYALSSKFYPKHFYVKYKRHKNGI